MAEPFRVTRLVEFGDTDMAGIAHFSVFFRYMEAAEHAYLRSLGLSVAMEWEGERVGFPRVSAACDSIGCDPNGVSNRGWPLVAWQATQMPFQPPVSESARPGGLMIAARRGIHRRSAASQIAGSWPRMRLWPVVYQ